MHVLPPESLTAPRNRWDLAVEAILAAMLLFMPMAFGAVESWSEMFVIAGAAALAIIVAVRAARDRTFRPPLTAAYIPIAFFVLLITLQLTPLPRSVVGLLSPTSVTMRAELLGDAADAARFTTISLYPLATAHGLRMTVVAATVFVVTATVFRTAPQVKRLLAIVFAIGVAEAALALLQIVTQTNNMFWVLDVGGQHLSSGSFINYSNFCQFMNLSIGAGVALLLVRMQEEDRKVRREWAVSQIFGGARFQPHAALMAGLIVCVLAVLASRSRNGAVSMLAAAGVIAAALAVRGTLGRRGWMLAMLPLGAALVLLVFGFDAFYDRLATLQESNAFAERWRLTLDVLRAWRSFPIFGMGLDCHEYAFPMFDTSVVRELAAHADNDYAQLLEETGLVGALLVAAFVFIIGRMVVKLCRRGRTSLSSAAFGLAFGLLAVGLHSATDFGQRLPAVFCLTAIMCGLVVQIRRLEREAKSSRAHRQKLQHRSAFWRLAAPAGVAGVVLASAWLLAAAYRAFLGEQWWGLAFQLEERVQSSGDDADEEEVEDLLAASQRAFELEPGNVNYGYWLNARRWGALSRDLTASDGQLQIPPEAQPLVKRVADELTTVRRICPTFGPPHALEGQLRLLVLADPEGGKLIQQGVRLAPYDPPTCMIAGQVAAREGRIDDATALITRAVSLYGSYFHEAADIFLFELKRPELAQKLAGDDYMRLSQLANMCRENADYAQLAADLDRAAEKALRRHVEDPRATAADFATLAFVEVRHVNYPVAIELFRRALARDYNQVEWRLELARVLAKLERLDEAAHEAQICVRLRPGFEPAIELANEIGKQQARAAQ